MQNLELKTIDYSLIDMKDVQKGIIDARNDIINQEGKLTLFTSIMRCVQRAEKREYPAFILANALYEIMTTSTLPDEDDY